jgi:hypothetical protein
MTIIRWLDEGPNKNPYARRPQPRTAVPDRRCCAATVMGRRTSLNIVGSAREPGSAVSAPGPCYAPTCLHGCS